MVTLNSTPYALHHKLRISDLFVLISVKALAIKTVASAMCNSFPSHASCPVAAFTKTMLKPLWAS